MFLSEFLRIPLTFIHFALTFIYADSVSRYFHWFTHLCTLPLTFHLHSCLSLSCSYNCTCIHKLCSHIYRNSLTFLYILPWYSQFTYIHTFSSHIHIISLTFTHFAVIFKMSTRFITFFLLYLYIFTLLYFYIYDKAPLVIALKSIPGDYGMILV